MKTKLKKVLSCILILLILLSAVPLTVYGASDISGDADGDGQISAADARLVLRASVGLEKSVDWLK